MFAGKLFAALPRGSLFATALVGTSGFAAVAFKKSVRTMSAEEAREVISPKEFRALKLVEILPVNHDTKRFRFSTGDDHTPLNMTVASCLVTKATIDGKDIIRPYTPASQEDVKGHFDLVIKVYKDGNMSRHVHSMKVGETLLFKGPFPKIEIKENMTKHIGMVAGGTGLTPMLQVIQHLLANKNDQTKMTLIFANRSEDDIILRKELDAMAVANPDRLKIFYMVDKAQSKDWKYGQGYINKETITSQFPPPGTDNMVFVCGPPPFMKAISGDKAEDKTQGELSGILKDLGYTKEQVFKF
eukprot:m.9055 g.9055  ORF g.9055 m.9055 type:complete len:300 (-) comp5377_c0_seq1:71-970(-)